MHKIISDRWKSEDATAARWVLLQGSCIPVFHSTRYLPSALCKRSNHFSISSQWNAFFSFNFRGEKLIDLGNKALKEKFTSIKLFPIDVYKNKMTPFVWLQAEKRKGKRRASWPLIIGSLGLNIWRTHCKHIIRCSVIYHVVCAREWGYCWSWKKETGTENEWVSEGPDIIKLVGEIRDSLYRIMWLVCTQLGILILSLIILLTIHLCLTHGPVL